MTTVDHASMLHRSHVRGERTASVDAPSRSVSISLSAIAIITVAISAWGGIIPYVGPTFGYSADGSSAWQWSLTHTVLALVPGAIGILVGLSFLARIPDARIGRRKTSLSTAGFIAILCGAWFVIGPLAWPVIHNSGPYFVAASPLRMLANQVGYSLGVGLILAMCGAFAIGWATRHNRPLTETNGTRTVATDEPVVPASTAPAGAVADY
jgi:MFS family permease